MMNYQNKKIFIYRNYTVESLFSKYSAVEYGDYDGFEGYSGGYDLYLWFYMFPIKNNPELSANEINNIYNKLELVLDGMRESNTTFILFTIEDWSPFSFQNSNFIVSDAINNYNEKLRVLEASNDSIKVIDIRGFSKESQIKEMIDWKYFYISQMVINPKLVKPFQNWFVKKLDSIYSIRKKCLVLDLDNTLWGGILGEDGPDGIKIGDTFPGSAYRDFQELISVASKNGVLLAVCSKNNEADVLEVWTKHPDMVLREQDFVCHRINWNDKASNIVEISKELNIGIDSFVFIDDNPIERELVKSLLPEVSVPQFPNQAYLLPDFFKKVYSDYFQIYSLTGEDKNKTTQYHQEKNRKKASSKFSSIEGYIRSLNIQLKIHSANKYNIPRIAQMTQKTNQFNLTTKRYTEDDIRQFVNGGHYVNCISVNDDFGENGITISSIFVLNKQEKTAHVDSFLLSCRILGRKVELCSFKFLLNSLFDKGIRRVEGQYIKTGKNSVCSEFYEDLKFELISEKNGIKNYALDLIKPIILSEDYKIEFEDGK